MAKKTARQDRIFLAAAAALIVAAGAAMLPSPAQAGFAWSPPPLSAAPAPAPIRQLDGSMTGGPIMPNPLDSMPGASMSGPGPAIAAAPVEPVAREPFAAPSPLLPEMDAAPENGGGIQAWPMTPSSPYENTTARDTRMADRNGGGMSGIMAEPLAPPASDTAGISWNNAAPAPMPMTAGSAETVQGFGSDIPLTIVAKQVVPSRYAVSFGPGVDAGQTVSWNGGRPWNEVLASALAPAGLRADMQGNAVVINRAGAPGGVMNASASGGPMPLMQDRNSIYRTIGMDESGYPTSYPRRMKSRGLNGDEGHPETQTAANDVLPVNNPPMDGMRGGMAQNNAPAPMSSPAMASAAPMDSAPAGFNPEEVRTWQAEQGEDLQMLLTRWSEASGVDLLWNVPGRYTLPVQIQMRGTYVDVITEVLNAYGDNPGRPTGQLHPNLPGGHAALVITNGQV